jgi:NAD+ synthase
MNLKGEIINWIKGYVINNNIKSLIIGVSGGIDSAVVSTLCAETGVDTIVVSLPIHQNINQLNNAEKHINWLINNYKNVTQHKYDMTKVFDLFSKQFNNSNDLSLANSRSRLRMMTLYHIACNNGGIVIGTGNKIEDFGVGFFTKYGDGGVDISPIADLYKSEVYALGKELNVIEEIIKAKPTDGLWGDDRDDESQLGATYDELEWAMKFVENNTINNPNIELLTKRQSEVLKIYKKFNNNNKHKMVEIPIFKKK